MTEQSPAQSGDEVPDPRSARGQRHPLPAVLNLTVLAILAGMKPLEAVAQFGRDHGPEPAPALGFERARHPTKSALGEILRRLDVDAFEAVPARLILAGEADGWTGVPIDGEALRGSRRGEVPGAHLLAALVPAAEAVIGRIKVDGKADEREEASRLLGMLPLEGQVVTGDAMFTHRDVASEILKGEGDHLSSVKDGRATGPNDRQRARPPGDPHAAEHDAVERLSGLAGGRAGVRVGATQTLQRRDRATGGGSRDHQPEPR